MTPDDYKFSIKLNKLITHFHKLQLTEETRERIGYILDTTQALGNKIGALLIQLPASFKFDLENLDTFLAFLTKEVRSRPFAFDLAIEFRNRYWLPQQPTPCCENTTLPWPQPIRHAIRALAR